MYIQRLKVENWKNFLKGDVRISKRLFLIGPNASGKSNFLDIFRFLRDLSLSKGGGLRQAVESRGGVSALRCLAARKKPDILIEVELNDENDGKWVYRLRFNQNKQRIPLIKEELVKHNDVVVLKRPDEDDDADELRLTQTALEQINANKDFRPVVNFFQSVNYQHLLPQVIRDPQGFSPSQIENDPFGRDFLQRVESTSERLRDVRLNKILSALKVAAPQLKELKIIRDKFGIPHLIGLFAHWRPHAGKQNETQFSDGTLRLFGLLWSLFEGEGPLLMEEPELSLHSEVVRHLPSLIERVNRHRKTKRQFIVSTHSEEILADKSISAHEVLRLEPSQEGTLLKSPVDNPEEVAQLKAGLTVADVILPKSAPDNAKQLEFSF
ncbi:MAG: AAA family ATPase [Acidobacteria bacterium]|nr:AAA family ATPase [Acidobacteriota bacterium]